MKLATYLAQMNLSDEQFAAMVQRSRSTISRLRNGRAIPSPELMRDIFTVTGGSVRADDFYGIGEAA